MKKPKSFLPVRYGLLLLYYIMPALAFSQSGLSGSYQIGAGKDFATLTNAIDTLKVRGVSGAVTLLLTSTYNSSTENYPITIDPIAGASAANRITIKPASGMNLTIAGAAKAVIKLNGSDYVTIDGSNNGSDSKNLTISNLRQNDNVAGIWLRSLGHDSGATNNLIKNCTFQCSGSYDFNFGVYLGGDSIYGYYQTGENDSNSIINNTIKNIGIGIGNIATYTGHPNKYLVISGNTIGHDTVYRSIRFKGIMIYGGRNITIDRNKIYNIHNDNFYPAVGIELNGEVKNSKVDANLIYGVGNDGGYPNTGQGITLNCVDTNSQLLVSNNVIHTIKGPVSYYGPRYNKYGISILSGGGYYIQHNSVSLVRFIQNNKIAALFVDSGVSNLYITNNVLSITTTFTDTTGRNYALYTNSGASAFKEINYNDYYSRAPGCKLAFFVNATDTDITQLRAHTGQDNNSFVANPLFKSIAYYSVNDLRFPSSSPLIGAGKFNGLVTMDFDGFSRHSVTPTIGAYEDSVLFYARAVPDTLICKGDSVRLGSTKLNTQWNTGYTFLWSPTAGLDSSTVANPLASPSSNTTYIVTMSDPGGVISKDTVSVSLYHPGINLGRDTTYCSYNGITLDPGAGFASYHWTNGDSTRTITAAGGSWGVTVTDTNGCKLTDSILIVNFPPASVTLGNDTGICQGKQYQLYPGSFSSYLWSDSSTSSMLIAKTAGIYFVKVTDSNGCTATDSVVISINPLPVPQLGNDSAICKGFSLDLDPGSGFSAYLWNDSSVAQKLNVTTAGSFSVSVLNTFGCAGSDTVHISLFPDPVVSLGKDTSICPGSIVPLNAGTGFSSYLWSDNSTGQQINAAAAGNYSVRVSNASGCFASDSILIGFNPIPQPYIGKDTSICPGGNMDLDAGAGFSAYRWNNHDNKQIINITTSGTYFVTVTNSWGCLATDTIDIQPAPKPVVSLGNDTSICSGSSIQLSPGSNFSSYLWNDNSSHSTFMANISGTYSVSVTNIYGCSAQDSMILTIELNEDASFTKTAGTIPGSFEFTAASSTASGYYWDFGDGGSAVTRIANHTYTSSGSKTVTLFVSNNIGCLDSSNQNIMSNVGIEESAEIIPLRLYPNPFSVQSVLYYSLSSTEKVSIELYEMNGRKVFASSDKLQSPGDYSFTINAEELKLATGSYIIRMATTEQTGQLRFNVISE